MLSIIAKSPCLYGSSKPKTRTLLAPDKVRCVEIYLLTDGHNLFRTVGVGVNQKDWNDYRWRKKMNLKRPRRKTAGFFMRWASPTMNSSND